MAAATEQDKKNAPETAEAVKPKVPRSTPRTPRAPGTKSARKPKNGGVIKSLCACCRAELTEARGWHFPPRFGGGFVPYCPACMERIYKAMAATVGYKLALYLCCAMFFMPYRPDLLERAAALREANGVFGGYMAALREDMHVSIRGYQSFRDGVTDITKAFGGAFGTLEVDDNMLDDAEYRQGLIEQERDWGKGPPDRPYTQEDYDELDKYYEALTENRVNLTGQVEMAIRSVCVLKLEQRYCIHKGDFTEAKKLEDIIKAEMEAEQLRKKDELPQDRVRMDDIVLACERAGLLGKSYEELTEILARKMFHTKYGYCRDAADQMLLYIVNATRYNDGYPELDRLPDEFAMMDTGEFAARPDETERNTYRELQIAPLHMKAEGSGA